VIAQDSNTEILKQLSSIAKQIDGLKASTKPWLSVNELSEYLGIKRATIYKYVYQKQIPHQKIPGSRKLIFSKNDIDKWIGNTNDLDQNVKKAKKEFNRIWESID